VYFSDWVLVCLCGRCRSKKDRERRLMEKQAKLLPAEPILFQNQKMKEFAFLAKNLFWDDKTESFIRRECCEEEANGDAEDGNREEPFETENDLV
jgi:hypothetical protein